MRAMRHLRERKTYLEDIVTLNVITSKTNGHTYSSDVDFKGQSTSLVFDTVNAGGQSAQYEIVTLFFSEAFISGGMHMLLIIKLQVVGRLDVNNVTITSKAFSHMNLFPYFLKCNHLLEELRTGKQVYCVVCYSSMSSIHDSGKISYPIQRHGLSKLKYKLSPDDGSRGYESLNVSDPFSYYGAHHKKKAFLCGVTYKKQKYTLKGTINDVKSMRALLIDNFNFPVEGILVLSELEPRSEYMPTKENMRRALKWLVSNMRYGDSLVFYYSGHGLRQLDFENDELDGFDETICPVDFKTTGMILDNEINDTIVRPLPFGVTLHAFVDSCHSGTILDLPNVYDTKTGKWMDNTPPSGAYKSTNGGFAVSLSACDDKQIAADTTAFTGKEMRGAMTWSLVNALSQKPNLTYEELLEYTVEAIARGNLSSNRCSQLLKKVFGGKMVQDPQLSASQVFDIRSTKVQL